MDLPRRRQRFARRGAIGRIFTNPNSPEAREQRSLVADGQSASKDIRDGVVGSDLRTTQIRLMAAVPSSHTSTVPTPNSQSQSTCAGSRSIARDATQVLKRGQKRPADIRRFCDWTPECPALPMTVKASKEGLQPPLFAMQQPQPWLFFWRSGAGFQAPPSDTQHTPHQI